MRASKLLRVWVALWIVMPLAVAGTAVTAQTRLCSTVPDAEREFARSIGACRDGAPIIDVAPSTVEPERSVVVAVPAVVGLGFDDARNRLAGFSVRRSYRPSAEPGGTVLEQQPAPATRLAAGAIVRLVLSDGTLRPAPRVSAAEIDGVANSAATQTGGRPQPAVPSNSARPGQAIEQSPAGAAAQSGSATPLPRTMDSPAIDRLVVPNVGGMMFRDAQARLGNFRVQRRERPSSAPIGRVVEQIPRASARAPLASVVTLVVSSGPAPSTPVIETFEVPNVVGRSYADASAALSEFKVARIEKASEAPTGQVLAQEPVPGTALTPGSAVGLQVSDGSLASGAVTAPADTATPPVTTPAVETAPMAATAPAVETAPAAAAVPSAETTTPAAAPPVTAATSAPAQSNRLPVTFPSSATLLLIAGMLFGIGLGALLTRRWFMRRRPMEDFELLAPVRIAPTEIDDAAVAAAVPAPVPAVVLLAVPSAETVPEIRFAARLDVGETTVELAAPSDADEMTIEHSRELHE
ncbi:MAG: PASTA domain-containing protein [Burkholderiaceae bacterium]